MDVVVAVDVVVAAVQSAEADCKKRVLFLSLSNM